MKTILLILAAVLALLIVLLLIAVIHTLLMPSRKSSYTAPKETEKARMLAEKLSRMIQYDTISHAGVHEEEKFLGFHKLLEELFPLVHKQLEKTVID